MKLSRGRRCHRPCGRLDMLSPPVVTRDVAHLAHAGSRTVRRDHSALVVPLQDWREQGIVGVRRRGAAERSRRSSGTTLERQASIATILSPGTIPAAVGRGPTVKRTRVKSSLRQYASRRGCRASARCFRRAREAVPDAADGPGECERESRQTTEASKTVSQWPSDFGDAFREPRRG